jgi:hypothetical protein
MNPTDGTDVTAIERRVSSLEVEHFGLIEQLRQVQASATRSANGLDDLEEVLTELSVTVSETSDTLRSTAAGTPRPTQPGQAGADPDQRDDLPDLAALHSWVEQHIAPLVRRTTTTGEGGGLRWCRRWWEHGDARDRFTALLLAHRELTAQDSATWHSVWLRDHLDPHFAVLTSPYGPFYACSPRKHSAAIEPLGHAGLPSDPPTQEAP